MRRNAAQGVLIVLAVAVASSLAGAQLIPADETTHNCRFVMVPMRDGVKLNIKVCEAKRRIVPRRSRLFWVGPRTASMNGGRSTANIDSSLPTDISLSIRTVGVGIKVKGPSG